MPNIGDIIIIKEIRDRKKFDQPIVCEIIGILPFNHSSNFNKLNYYILGGNQRNMLFDKKIQNDIAYLTELNCVSLNKYSYYAYYSIKDFFCDVRYETINQTTLNNIVLIISNELI